MTKAKLGMIFSGYVSRKRAKRGLTQEQLATAVSTSLRWMQKIESGSKLPGFFLAIKLIVFLDIDMDSLLSEVAAELAKKEGASCGHGRDC